MPRQFFLRDRIEADRIEAYPLVISGDDIIENVEIDARIVPEISFVSPETVPSRIEQKKIRFLRLLSVSFDTIHRDPSAFLQISAVDHQCSADKLIDRKSVQSRSPAEQVCRRIHMRSRMGEHPQFRFLEPFSLVRIRRNERRRFGSRIYRHIRLYRMG